MVENKKTKRERDIKTKLMAAIAMLLVSSIMMVSTTYAWFTLSTAPEVTGITTTIASNGNLEIALSPVDGDLTKVGNADTSTSTTDMMLRNLTWGNLLDMRDARYNLANLTLAPAQLAAVSATIGGQPAYVLGGSPLATPHYGSDGRISSLVADADFGGTDLAAVLNSNGTKSYVPAATTTGSNGWIEDKYEFGVRAVGTVSGMSAQALSHKTNVQDIANNASRATTAAGDTLKNNGQALASIMVQKATGTSDDYSKFTADLKALTTELQNVVGHIDAAMKAALKAMASTLTDETEFNAALSKIDGIDFSTMSSTTGGTTTFTGSLKEIVDGIDNTNAVSKLEELVGKRNQLAADINAAADEAGKLGTTVTWNDVSKVVNYLMNTTGVKISGLTVDQVKDAWDIKDMDTLTPLLSNTEITLGADSGVYYDIAVLAGDYGATTTVTIDGSFIGAGEMTKECLIRTEYGKPSDLSALRAIANNVIPASDTANAVMDAFYGYSIDLVLRTNAADSWLELLTEGEQRVYDNSPNQQTLGGGSTIIFTTTNSNNVNVLQKLCESIRIAFFDPTNSEKLMGIAKVTSVDITTETSTDGTVTTSTITGHLSLCSYTVDGNNLVTVGNAIVDSDAQDGKDETKALCKLTQNLPQAVSALVYLDGATVTSADVLANSNATGTLNLQFGSSAALVPMDNSELYNGTEPAQP